MILVTAALALDTNHDGMDDLWQARYNIAPFAGALDPDGDGRINFAEAMNMSDPLNTQNPGLGMIHITDLNPADGLDDRWQTRFSLTAADKLLDHDGDGRSALEESYVNSDPFVADMPWTQAGSTQGGGAAAGPQEFILTMPWTIPGWRYTLQCSDTLMQNEWSTAAVAPGQNVSQWGTGGALSVTATTGGAERKFFRWLIDSPDTDGDGLGDWEETQLGSNVEEFDSDNDGVPDNFEYESGSDLNDAAALPRPDQPEVTGWKPVVYWGGQSKSVDNIWRQDLIGGQTTSGGTLWWTAPDGTSDTSQYDPFEARWSSKLSDLAWLAYSAPGAWQTISPFAEASLSSYDYDDPPYSGAVRTANVTHRLLTLTTSRGIRKPLTFAEAVMKVGYTRPNGITELRQYESVEVIPILFGDTSSYGDEKVPLDPLPADGSTRVRAAGHLGFSCAALPRALDVETYGPGNFPEPWITVPAGTAPLDVTMGGAPTGDVVFRPLGAGLDETVQDGALMRLQSSSPTAQLGSVEAGFRSADGSILYAQRPVLRVAVWPQQDLHINIIPIAYGNGTAVGLPQHLPPAAAVEQFLDSIYLPQANIKCHVVIQPPHLTDWDAQGRGMSHGDTVSVNDGVMSILYSSHDQDLTTGEEFIATLGAPVNTAEHTINVFWVVAHQIVQYQYKTGADAAALNLKKVEGFDVSGFAFMNYRRNGVFQCWVRDMPATVDGNALQDTPPPPGMTALWVMAHEIGHMLGLGHSNFQVFENTAPFDYEKRLMTGRYGPKRCWTPWQLTHRERMVARIGFSNLTPSAP